MKSVGEGPSEVCHGALCPDEPRSQVWPAGVMEAARISHSHLFLMGPFGPVLAYFNYCPVLGFFVCFIFCVSLNFSRAWFLMSSFEKCSG